MSRRSEGPWRRSGRDGWYATVGGKQVRLVGGDATEEEARKAWHRLMAAPRESPAPKGRGTARGLLDLFLDHVRDNRSPATWIGYRDNARSFARECGDLPAEDVRPHHVITWAGSKGWAPSTRRAAISIIKAAFSWARKAGHLDTNPIADTERPARTRRAAIITTEMADRVAAEEGDGLFGDFFAAIRETGCRPGEVAKVEARDFDPARGTWTVKGKTTTATGKMRVIYLNSRMAEMSARLARANPTGPLFRNSRGNPWTKAAYGIRIRRARARLGLGKEVVACSLRHLFITDALEDGESIATVAELVGHSGTDMISQVYSMLHQRTDHLRAAVERIRPATDRDRTSPGGTPPGGPPAPSGPPAKPPRRRRGPPA